MSVRDEDLQRFFDGELPPEERRRVEEAIARDPTAPVRLRALAELRELLREAMAEAEAGAPTGAWARVRAEIGSRPGLGERLGEWLRRRWYVPTLAVGAAAVVATYVAVQQGIQEEARHGRRSRTMVAKKFKRPPPPIVKLESLEASGGALVTVFDAPDEGGVPVLWIEEE